MKIKIIGCIFSLLGITFAVMILFDVYQQKNRFLILYNTNSFEDIINSDFEPSSAEELHNYGNAAFQSFSGSSFQNLGYLHQAVESYSGSLALEEHEITRVNYEISSKLLDLFINEEEKSNQDESRQGEGNHEQDSGGEGQESSEESSGDSQNAQQNQRESEYFLEEAQEIGELSEEEKEQLQETLNSLLQDQVSNQRFYGKQEQENNFNTIFDSFFGNINRGGEKDW